MPIKLTSTEITKMVNEQSPRDTVRLLIREYRGMQRVAKKLEQRSSRAIDILSKLEIKLAAEESLNET